MATWITRILRLALFSKRVFAMEKKGMCSDHQSVGLPKQQQKKKIHDLYFKAKLHRQNTIFFFPIHQCFLYYLLLYTFNTIAATVLLRYRLR